MRKKFKKCLINIFSIFIASLIIVLLISIGCVIGAVLFLIAIIWLAFWVGRLENYISKKYPSLYKKFRKEFYHPFSMVHILKATIDTIMFNPYPDDKKYSYYVNMCRIGMLLILIFAIYIAWNL